MGKLKRYAVVLGIGAVLGITIAETWRRKVLHDSYANYLPPPPAEREGATADGPSPASVRGAAKRLWFPVAASAREELMRIRRIRAGAPRPVGFAR